MSKDNKNYIKTGEGPLVDEWINNNWPDSAKEAVMTCVPDYMNTMRLRTSTSGPKVSNWGNRVQIVLNYNHDKDCFIVWNAAIQRSHSSFIKTGFYYPFVRRRFRSPIASAN